jgi:arylsulfatase A-like enzyme
MPKNQTIKRRDFLKTVSAFSVLGLSGSFVKAADKSSRRPNVLFLFSDQHHASAMGCAGHEIVKTPNMDKLAANGVRFNRVYCQDGICVPSRTSILTGLYPRTTGCLDNPNNPLHPERYVMLQHLFQQNSYKTGCFGKRHLPGSGQMAYGWDASATTIKPRLDPSDENYEEWLKERGLQGKGGGDAMKSNLFCLVSELKPQERDAAYTAEKSKAFLRDCKEKESPFFCWATFHGPHHTYAPPKKWIDMYPRENMILPPNINEPIENLPPELKSWRKNENTPWNLGTAAKHKDLYRTFLSHYFAQVTEVDHYMGEIIDELEALGLADNTIIIYASDHGDFMAYHGMTEKCALGHNVYEDTLRVPMIVSWPKRFKKGVVREDLVELLDIYPTLVDMLGLKKPANMQKLAGISLKPVLGSGKALGRKYAFSENWSQVSIVSERYKLGVWIDPGPLPRYAHRDNRKKFPDMLFDLKTDPLEVNNQIDNPELASVQAKLREELDRWTRETSSAGKDEYIKVKKKV